MKGLMKRSMSRCQVVGRLRDHGRAMVGLNYGGFGSEVKWIGGSDFGCGFVEFGFGLGVELRRRGAEVCCRGGTPGWEIPGR